MGIEMLRILEEIKFTQILLQHSVQKLKKLNCPLFLLFFRDFLVFFLVFIKWQKQQMSRLIVPQNCDAHSNPARYCSLELDSFHNRFLVIRFSKCCIFKILI